MKILGLEFGSRARDWFLTTQKKTWLIVDTSKVKTYWGSLSHCEVCSTYECDTEEEAREYIENNVTKSHLKHTRIFKEVDSFEPEIESHN